MQGDQLIEVPQKESLEIYGYNLFKVVRNTQLVVGTILCLSVIGDFITLGFINPFGFSQTIFHGFFGLLILAACCQLEFIKENYYFLTTGTGKGGFNLFIGLQILVFKTSPSIMNIVTGIALLISGSILIFLSRFKHISDEQIAENTKFTADDAKATAMDAVRANKDSIAGMVHRGQDSLIHAVHDHKDVIAQAASQYKDDIAKAAVHQALDNRDVLAQTALDNRDVIIEQIAKNQKR